VAALKNRRSGCDPLAALHGEVSEPADTSSCEDEAMGPAPIPHPSPARFHVSIEEVALLVSVSGLIGSLP
jgi:hypothetical protein